MKISYIILTHRDPTLIEKIIENLYDENSFFYIHVDKKRDISKFLYLEKYKNVKLVKNRIDVKWGHVSIVDATLNSIKQSLLQNNSDYFFIISGQDYPIKNKLYIQDIAKNNKNYIKYFSLPNPIWKAGGTHRFNRFHLFINRNKYLRRIENVLNFFLPRRKIPLNHKAYGGDFWCSLNVETVNYIFNFLNNNPEYKNFYKNTYLADEIFFQTIILNSTEDIIKNTINDTITYVDWEKPGKFCPAVLTIEDFDRLEKSTYLFARKIDSNESKVLIEKINSNLLQI